MGRKKSGISVPMDILEALKARGVTQKEIAEKIGVTYSTVCHWYSNPERGISASSAAKLKMLYEAILKDAENTSSLSSAQIMVTEVLISITPAKISVVKIIPRWTQQPDTVDGFKADIDFFYKISQFLEKLDLVWQGPG